MSQSIRHYIRLVEAASATPGAPLLTESGVEPAVIDAAVASLYQSIDWSGGCGETVMYYYNDDHGHGRYDDYDAADDADTDEDDGEVDHRSPEFKTWFARWAEDRVHNGLWAIENCFKGNSVKVWRKITAPRDWKPDPNRHPGVYWSWKESAAEAHWGSHGTNDVTWTLEARLNRQDIDWVETLAQNAHPSMEDECEIRVRDGVPVKILKYYPGR